MGTLKTRFAASAAKKLRSAMTDAENRLWYHLRNHRFMGHKFVRQHPVGPFVADFACREADLIIELDGGQHSLRTVSDARRTEILKSHGYRVRRFWNADVLNNIDGVLQIIADDLDKAPSPGLRYAKSDLSPKGEVTPAARFEPFNRTTGTPS